MSDPQILMLDQVRTDGGTQMRAEISAEKVSEYAGHIEDGVVFPPVIAYYDGDQYWLVDGFHRVAAHHQVQDGTVRAIVHAGTREDAVRYALRANAENGKDRSPGDLRRCYQTAIENGFCEPHDTKAVKALIRCSSRHAENMTREARVNHQQAQKLKACALAKEGKTQREIADDLEVGLATVNRWLVPKSHCADLEQGQPETTATAPPQPGPPPPKSPPADNPPPREATAAERDEIADMRQTIDAKIKQLAEMKAEGAQREAQNKASYLSQPELQAQSLYRTINSWLSMILDEIAQHEAKGESITPDEHDRAETLNQFDQLKAFLERATQ